MSTLTLSNLVSLQKSMVDFPMSVNDRFFVDIHIENLGDIQKSKTDLLELISVKEYELLCDKYLELNRRNYSYSFDFERLERVVKGYYIGQQSAFN